MRIELNFHLESDVSLVDLEPPVATYYTAGSTSLSVTKSTAPYTDSERIHWPLGAGANNITGLEFTD